jgi:hypothetical protein
MIRTVTEIPLWYGRLHTRLVPLSEPLAKALRVQVNSVLQTIVNPLGTAIIGAFGADQNINHST